MSTAVLFAEEAYGQDMYMVANWYFMSRKSKIEYARQSAKEVNVTPTRSISTQPNT